MNRKAQTAIVILNWNGASLLSRYLPSLLKYTPEELTDIYVADNASTDNSLETLNAFPRVRIIRLDKNYGFAEGYNKALKELPHPYFILLNSDIEVTPGWLEPLYKYMQEHPETAACQPKVKALYEPDAFEHAGAAGGFIDHYGYPFCRGRMMHLREKDHGQYDTICSLFWATGACLMIRRDDYFGTGGLDSRFFAHMEEIDLCWRLRARNRDIVCIPQSTVYHLGGGTLNKSNPYKTYLNFRNNLLMLYKNLPEQELKPVMRIRFLLDCIASLSFLAKGNLAEFMAVWKARRAYRRMLPEMQSSRTNNLALTVLDPPERIRHSLIKAFYLQQIRTFTAWEKQWNNNTKK